MNTKSANAIAFFVLDTVIGSFGSLVTFYIGLVIIINLDIKEPFVTVIRFGVPVFIALTALLIRKRFYLPLLLITFYIFIWPIVLKIMDNA